MSSLTLQEMNDREILARLNDIADADGFTTSRLMAQALGLTDKNGPSCVGSRLAWLRRYDAVDKDGKRWRLTERGHTLIKARLRTSQVRALGSAEENQLVEVVDLLGVAYGGAHPATANLVRRQWLHSTGGGRSVPMKGR
jgi:hypothetical protein